MEKKQAQELIKKVLQHKFDLDLFRHFISNLLNDFDRSKERGWSGKQYIYADYREHINNFKRLGVYTASYGEEIEILIVKTESVAKLDRARTSLRNFVVKWLQDDKNKSRVRDYALAAFFSGEDNGADWRFSFIKVEHESYKDEKGKVKIRADLTPARRYSYLVGEHENSYTAQKQLLPLLEADYANPTIGVIENAFSVEKVTGEFFQQYKELYHKLEGYFNKEESLKNIITEAGIEVSRFTKKLLGQIVFLYFLQKKGWLGVKKNDKWGSGDKKFLRTLFDKATGEGKNFYSSYLQYLFYEALAKERGESSAPGYYHLFDCKIPFLNGGLFEADYDWQNRPVAIPDSFFHKLEKNKNGDIGTGILDVFDRYNFTIKEDEPLEKEVAVDPEMLGKVFENMLDIVERKSSGAYYTPREIVHYMCRESLIHYLDTTVNAEEEKCSREALEQLLREGSWTLENDKRVMAEGKETDTYKFKLPQCIRTHAAILDEKLDNIKICDPAIGSGAFPVGLLHEIVNTRLLLQSYYASQSLIKTAYDLKRHAIQKSIYGVDSDASAVDIARLRLWLSLIVDEEDYDCIDALPNLDYKIVRGNSLVGIPNGALRDRNLETEIEMLKEQYYPETDESKKKSLRREIDIKIGKFLKSAEALFPGYKIDFDFKLFFSEVWNEKNGFDVVIGNPPYVQVQKFSGQQQQYDWEKQNYETYAKTGDIYCLFYEKGIRILRDGGTLTFITSNKWMRANYGKNTRKYFLNNVTINQLIDFGDSPIFKEATTYTNILILSKKQPALPPKVWDASHIYNTTTSLETVLSREKTGNAVFSENAFIIAKADQEFIKKRIEEIGTPLKEWNISINYGIKTGFNEAFIIDGKKKKELISNDSKNEKIIKPVLRGRNIKRYSVDFP
ncbi:MAG: Eco57I restriction-modification methylase domain-containing protein, partial [Acidobacteria bacterium]|nr:Eco57I restriction-modification methylase domain-containing protein [Acidobacteriota bacterium]